MGFDALDKFCFFRGVLDGGWTTKEKQKQEYWQMLEEEFVKMRL